MNLSLLSSADIHKVDTEELWVRDVECLFWIIQMWMSSWMLQAFAGGGELRLCCEWQQKNKKQWHSFYYSCCFCVHTGWSSGAWGDPKQRTLPLSGIWTFLYHVIKKTIFPYIIWWTLMSFMFALTAKKWETDLRIWVKVTFIMILYVNTTSINSKIDM